MKKGTKKDIATSFTTLLFLVIGISGVMMFFHFNDNLVKNLHEILGLVFVLAVLFHIVFNWASMKNYFSKKIFMSIAVVIVLISGVFMSQSSNQTSDPKMLIIKSTINAPIKNSLAILNIKYQDAIQKLKDQNFKEIEGKSIGAIAKANNTSPFKIIGILTTK